jgi:hypothetical protein
MATPFMRHADIRHAARLSCKRMAKMAVPGRRLGRLSGGVTAPPCQPRGSDKHVICTYMNLLEPGYRPKGRSITQGREDMG